MPPFRLIRMRSHALLGLSCMVLVVGPGGASCNDRSAQPSVASRSEQDPKPELPSGCRALPGSIVVDGRWDRIEHEASGVAMRYIPPGEYVMGSPASDGLRAVDEQSHRRVIRKGFYLGETEVTVGQWRRFVGLTGYRTDAERGTPWHDYTRGGFVTSRQGKGEWCDAAQWMNPFPHLPDYRLVDAHPVVMVSWSDSMSFCEHYALSLPSEAQWEWACRAGANTQFPWGRTSTGISRYANVADAGARQKFALMAACAEDDGAALLASVGSYEANAYGLRDMVGNVAEWCRDSYKANYPADGAGDEAATGSGMEKVARGGSWFHLPVECRPAYRMGNQSVALRNDYLGFRVALVP